MNREELKGILPHRDTMLLIDKATCKNDVAYGSLHINGDEWFLQGHFPDKPVVPGVILCEVLAQSTCVLLKERLSGERYLPLFTGLEKVRFRRPVVPGETFKTECTITRERPPFYFAKGKGYVGGELCVEASLSFALTEV